MSVPGFGTILEYGNKGDGTSTTWTPIAELVDVEPPMEEASDIDTTHMQSANKRRTYQGGLINPGEVKLTAHYIIAAYNTLRGMIGVQTDLRLTFNDAPTTTPSKQVMQGYIKGLGPKTPIDGVDTFEITYKVSGEPVFTAGT